MRMHFVPMWGASLHPLGHPRGGGAHSLTHCPWLHNNHSIPLMHASTVRACVQSVAMLRSITSFHNLATQAVERTASGGAEGHKITFNVIKQRLGDVLYKITSQKFEDPADGEEAVK